jgi:serine protease Do
LVGINTAILAGDGGGNQGIGFAIPINLAHNVMDQLLKNGKVTRGFMGILPQEVTPDIATGFGNPNLKGVAVAQVEPNSPAQQAGLKVGDVITGINGTSVSDVNQFRLQIAGMSPGTKADLKIVRDGREQNVDVTLAEMSKKNLRGTGDGDGDDDSDQGAMQGKGEKGALPGVSVQAVTPELKQQLQLPDSVRAGVVITDVDQSSRAADSGLQQGDVVTQVNHKPVNTVAEFNAAVKAGGANGSTLLLVQRGGGAVFLAVNK